MDYKILEQLPQLLISLKGNWPVLPSGMWNSSGIQKVLRLLHELARKSDAIGLVNIFELSQAIEKAISDVLEENEQPDTDEVEQLNQLLEELTHVIEATGSNTASHSAEPKQCDVLYLPRRDTKNDLIYSAIEKNGWQVRQLSDMNSLHRTLLQQQTKLLLIDTLFLPELDHLTNTLSELKQTQEQAPELIFLSNQCDVEIRLEVLRAGATQCFSEPISVNDLMTAIKGILSPELQPHYRVLVVEDDESQAKFTCTLLKKGGLETLAITDPLHVMDAVQAFQPDLILMDLYMPGANGIELTQLIRAKKEASIIPIVFLSGEDDVEKKMIALYSGADDFLTKPVRPQYLMATVKTRIERSKEILSGIGVNLNDDTTGLPNRRQLLQQLDLTCIHISPGREVSGLFTITLETEEEPVLGDGFSPDDNSLVTRVADVLGPVVGKRDCLARTGRRSLAVLVKRAQMKDIEILGKDLYRQLAGELSQGAGPEQRSGVGLITIVSFGGGAYHYLKQGEATAKQALDQEVKRCLNHQETVQIASELQHVGNDLLREQVRTALQSGFVQFHEQRYVAIHENGAIMEQIPSFAATTELTSEVGDIYQSAGRYDGMDILNRLLCQYAVRKLGEAALKGNPDKVLVWLSGLAIHDEQFILYLQSELRKLHVVGTGLIFEFDLPSLAPELKRARMLLDELSSLGITTLLGNFACNETAFKVLAYLNADAVRLHPSLMRKDAEKIDTLASQIRALNAFILLPRIEASEQINMYWPRVADYVQAEHIVGLDSQSGLLGLGAVD
jgi:PleD family two-component response regulator/EAL domain-containing protein (putative c-di-GMP-specific phosphodiesterase class I)